MGQLLSQSPVLMPAELHLLTNGLPFLNPTTLGKITICILSSYTPSFFHASRSTVAFYPLISSFMTSSYTILSSHFFLLGIEITEISKSGLYGEFIFNHFVLCLLLTNLVPSMNSTILWTARIQLLIKQQKKREKQEYYLAFISGHFQIEIPNIKFQFFYFLLPHQSTHQQRNVNI